MILMFFIVGALVIISNNSLALYYPENAEKFFDLYVFWLNKLCSNFLDITGDAIKMEWLPG
jgi:hypothetical protein